MHISVARKRGRPLGLASTGKKAFVPNSCSNQVDSLPPRVGFYSTNSNLSFRLLIPDRFRCVTSPNEAIRSVTHLVLAHKLPGSLSVLSLSLFFILKASESLSFLVFLAIDSARPSRYRGTRKRSVPVRVHSVDKSYGFVGARCQAAAVQPVFDSRHGRIACKTFLWQFTTF